MRAAHVLATLAVAVLASRAAPAQIDAHELPPPEPTPKEPPTGLKVPVSVVGGLRAGGAFNAGKNAPDSGSNPNGAVGGVDLGLEVGSVVFGHVYGGLLLDGTFFISPASTTSNVSSVLVATELGYLTSLDRFGALFGLGVGYRAIFVGDALGNANKFDGPEGLATVALVVPVGAHVHVLPRLDFGVGPSGPGNAHAIFVLGVTIWLGGPVWPPTRRHAP